ncbi:hypothetical protein [Tepidiforma sp.]|nr:hypothetical protein [Tepidiforma sp.]
MKQLALSTMFAQQERFEDGAMFAPCAAELSVSTPLASAALPSMIVGS